MTVVTSAALVRKGQTMAKVRGVRQPPITARALSGPKSIFRRKVRTRPPIVMTRAGHVRLAANLERLGGISRSDYFEALLHLFGDRVTLDDIHAIADKVNAENEAAAA